MANINLITTSAGRQAITTALASSANIQVADAIVSAAHQPMTAATTSMSAVAATLPAVGSVRSAGAGYALHVVITDDSSAAYDVRAVALRLVGGAFLMVYSQAGVIASKASGSSLHIAFDLTIDADTAATITFGDADYILPMASTTAPGLVELATSVEAVAGTDSVRAVTASGVVAKILDNVRTNKVWLAQEHDVDYVSRPERNIIVPITEFKIIRSSTGFAGNITIDEGPSGKGLRIRNVGNLVGGEAHATFRVPYGAALSRFQVLLTNPNNHIGVTLGDRTTDWTLPLDAPFSSVWVGGEQAPGSGLRMLTWNIGGGILSRSDVLEHVIKVWFPGGGNGDEFNGFRFQYMDPGPRNH